MYIIVVIIIKEDQEIKIYIKLNQIWRILRKFRKNKTKEKQRKTIPNQSNMEKQRIPQQKKETQGTTLNCKETQMKTIG